MAVPKQRRNGARQRRHRRSHAVLVKSTILCSSCNKQTVRHQACLHCGKYKGRSYS